VVLNSICDVKMVLTSWCYLMVKFRKIRMETQLLHYEKLAVVGMLAYEIAHEFNNILAGMMVNAELGLTLDDSVKMKECFESIVDNCQRGSSTTYSLLAMAGEKKGKKEFADITKTLRGVLSFIHREMEKTNIKTAESYRPTPRILCDPAEFTEVFLNFITNARDAINLQGGTLTIELEHIEDNIRIVFKDTECGIEDEIKTKIFDPFVTTKGALGKSEVTRTDLGLFLSYGIIDKYEGRIEVDSKLEKGTTFTILVPVSRNLPP
jgi:signal transduction histidine kinase